jgi:hypothetical protein
VFSIKIYINKEKDNISSGSLCTTDWLNNIKENKIVIKDVEKNIISSTKFLSKLHSLGYIKKLSKNKGYIPNEKYLKKGYFEDYSYNLKDENGNIKKTIHTIYITRKGQKKLLKLVLGMIEEKQ